MRAACTPMPVVNRCCVRVVDSVASTATPMAAPICRATLINPEAKPVSSALTPDMPRVMFGAEIEAAAQPCDDQRRQLVGGIAAVHRDLGPHGQTDREERQAEGQRRPGADTSHEPRRHQE